MGTTTTSTSTIPNTSDNTDVLNSENPRNPIQETFGPSNRKALVAAILVPTLNACSYYVVFVWLVIFMESILQPPIPDAFLINSVNGLLGGILLTLFGGWLADYVGDYNKLMVWSTIALCISTPVAMSLFGKGGEHSFALAFILQLILAFLVAIFSGALFPWLMFLCPPEIRLTTVAMGYNVSISVWGGFAPLLATVLADQINFVAAGCLVTASGLLTLIGLWLAPDPISIKEDTENDDENGYRLM